MFVENEVTTKILPLISKKKASVKNRGKIYISLEYSFL